MFYVLPIDEATGYNELLELLHLEKTELKRLDTAGKTDRVVDAALADGAARHQPGHHRRRPAREGHFSHDGRSECASLA